MVVIVDYLKSANTTNALLSGQLHGNPWDLWKRRQVPQKGGWNGLHYFFHGVGCNISTTELNVDFDYSFDGTIQTFDEWVIWKYCSQTTIDISRREFSETYAELMNLQLILDTPVGQGGKVHVLASRYNLV
jgi:hypothetical protein